MGEVCIRMAIAKGWGRGRVREMDFNPGAWWSHPECLKNSHFRALTLKCRVNRSRWLLGIQPGLDFELGFIVI